MRGVVLRNLHFPAISPVHKCVDTFPSWIKHVNRVPTRGSDLYLKVRWFAAFRSSGTNVNSDEAVYAGGGEGLINREMQCLHMMSVEKAEKYGAEQRTEANYQLFFHMLIMACKMLVCFPPQAVKLSRAFLANVSPEISKAFLSNRRRTIHQG